MSNEIPQNIALKQKIGETLESETWEAFDRSKKKQQVLRRMKSPSCAEKLPDVQNEINLWEAVRLEGLAIPGISQFGQDADGIWYIRDYVVGDSLAKSKPVREHEAARRIAALTSFVAKLHSKGLTHRNLKPTNIFFSEIDQAIAIDPDFGSLRDPNGVWANDIKSLVQLLAFILTSQPPETLQIEQIPENSRTFVSTLLQTPPATINDFQTAIGQLVRATKPTAFTQSNGAPTQSQNTAVPPVQDVPAAASANQNYNDVPEGAVCPQCHAPVQINANRVCPQCGRPYLEPCLNCQSLNPFWIRNCQGCGSDTTALKQNLFATLNQQKQQILKYRESYGHDKTLPLLKYMSTVNHPDFLAFREWAKNMALLIQKERKDIKTYVDNIRHQVSVAITSQKYDRVQQILEQVPRPLLDEQMRQQYTEAGDAITEVDSLVKEIRNALSTKQYSQLLSCVQRYLELKANDPEAQNLQRQIERLTTISSTKGIKFRRIPGGRFYMGSHDSDEYLRNNEHPQHRVVIGQNLFVGVYPITQKEFQELMEFNPSVSTENEDCPADSVTWYSAIEFCNKMSELEAFKPFYELKAVKKRANGSIEKADVTALGGDGYRLLTEAEWEYACRAGSITPWCFGDQVLDVGEYAWYFENSSLETHPVGRRKPNAWGLFDMHGNVMEWCHDWYQEFFYAQCPDEEVNPQGPGEGASKVLRGGAWQFGAEATRCAYRNSSTPDSAAGIIGFRVCRNANDEVM